MRSALGICVLCSCCLGQGPANVLPTTSEDLARGRRLFMGHCAPCHGPTGSGGRGADLARPQLPRAPDDKALFDVIQNGIDGTEMPGAWEMIDRELWQVAAFVRTLGRTAPQSLPGDPSRGEQLYRTKGNCSQCHAIAGAGGRLGPDLTAIGARRSPAYLRESVAAPEAAVPEGFLVVRVVTKDGQRVTGVRLNEDTYSIQLRDFSDGLHSFWKSELTELHKDWGKSPMPSYKDAFPTGELDDLVAYLASLRGDISIRSEGRKAADSKP